jgi:hypothetical protein
MYPQTDTYAADAYKETTDSPPPSPDWAEEVEGFVRRTNLQHVLERAENDQSVEAVPLRPALSSSRENLDTRTRDWRVAAKAVEQAMRQLMTAEHARGDALKGMSRAQSEIERTATELTNALASFDERHMSKNIAPLFKLSDDALAELERMTTELALAQMWCRSSWDAYTEALEREQQFRRSIQAPD